MNGQKATWYIIDDAEGAYLTGDKSPEDKVLSEHDTLIEAERAFCKEIENEDDGFDEVCGICFEPLVDGDCDDCYGWEKQDA